MTMWSKVSRFAPAALLAGVALLALVLQYFVFGDPTHEDDWKDAAAEAISRVGEDDLIRIHPTWRDASLVHLTEIGSQIDRKRRVIAEDLVGVSKFVVVAEVGRRAEALEAMPYAAEARDIREFGSVEVFEISVPEIDVPFTLRDELDQARVVRRRGDDEQVCSRWSAGERRWDCDKRDRWFFVGDELREVGDEPRRCIYAHPLGSGQTLALTWNEIELGTSFRLRSGLDLRGARSARGTDITVRLYIDDELVSDRRIAHNDARWHLDRVDTQPGSASVRVEVDSVGTHDRFFCFDGWVWNTQID